MKSILVVGILIAAVDASTSGSSLPPRKIAARADSDSEPAGPAGRLILLDGGRTSLSLQTQEWDARSSSPLPLAAPREVKNAVYLDDSGIRARRRAEAGSFGMTDMDIQMAGQSEDGDGDEPDVAPDTDQDKASEDEFDMAVQEEEILAYKEAQAGGDGDGDEPGAVPDADQDQAFLDEFDMEIQEEEILANKESKAGEDDMSVQEQEIIDNETAEKEILENDAAIESAKVDEIKEEENLLQKEVHEDKIEPGLAEEEIALLEETLEKEKKVEEEAMEKLSKWGHEVKIQNDNLDTEEDETYLSIKKLENKTM